MKQEEFNIDDLKKDWQTQQHLPNKTPEEVKKMLNKSSINNVKYILIISTIEFLLGIIASIFLFFFTDANENVLTLDLGQNHIQNIENYAFYLHLFIGIYLIVFFYFIVVFFKTYKNLQISSSVKDYIKQIIYFRQKANLFIYLNILISFVTTIAIFGFSFFEAFKIIEEKNLVISNDKILIGVIIIIIISLIISLLYWVYYKLLYGYFLKKLKKNLFALEQMES